MPSDKEEGFSFASQKYSTGDVAALLSMHPQSVRYFDKVGIITPDRNNDNHRRSYSIYDIYLLTLRNNYQRLGFSVRETENILNNANFSEISEQMREKVRLLQERIDLDTYLVQGMNEQQETLDHIQLFLDRCFFRTRPAAWRHAHIRNQDFCSDPDSCKARKLAVQLMPYSRYSFRFSKKELDNSHMPAYQCDVSIPEKAAVFYEFHHIPGSWYAPSRLCLYTILRLQSLRAPEWNDLLTARNFIIENDLQIDDDIFGDILISVNENGAITRYFEVWIPVKENK